MSALVAYVAGQQDTPVAVGTTEDQQALQDILGQPLAIFTGMVKRVEEFIDVEKIWSFASTSESFDRFRQKLIINADMQTPYPGCVQWIPPKPWTDMVAFPLEISLQIMRMLCVKKSLLSYSSVDALCGRAHDCWLATACRSGLGPMPGLPALDTLLSTARDVSLLQLGGFVLYLS